MTEVLAIKAGNLIKIELYRFFHSIAIIKYVVIIPLILFFMSYLNISYLGNEFSDAMVWASMSSVFLYLLALICVIIAVYVGREFQFKTINYEVMRGYGFCEIAFSKTISCGVLVPAILLICMVIYLIIFQEPLCEDFFLRVLLIFLLLVHIASCSMLYVLLCRNGVVGASIAFGRFLVLETVVQMAAGRFVSVHAGELIMKMNVFNQWYELIAVETVLSKEFMICIFMSAAAEYGILMGILKWKSGRTDM